MYFQAFHRVVEDGAEKDLFIAGRYVDRYERRDGVWKIAHRAFVMDWNQVAPNASEWEEGMFAELRVRGGRAPDDPFYRFLQEASR